MTDKELLLVDLSGRLPYGVKVKTNRGPELVEGLWPFGYYDIKITGNLDWWFLDFKPYLRPMSSMTEEENKQRKEFGILLWSDSNGKRGFDGFGNISGEDMIKAFDWLNAHHFDYRGLIEKGLALEAPEGMYKLAM